MLRTSVSAPQNGFSTTNVIGSSVLSSGVLGLDKPKSRSGDTSAWNIENIGTETGRYNLSSTAWT
jgi:hypothetical protein